MAEPRFPRGGTAVDWQMTEALDESTAEERASWEAAQTQLVARRQRVPAQPQWAQLASQIAAMDARGIEMQQQQTDQFGWQREQWGFIRLSRLLSMSGSSSSGSSTMSSRRSSTSTIRISGLSLGSIRRISGPSLDSTRMISGPSRGIIRRSSGAATISSSRACRVRWTRFHRCWPSLGSTILLVVHPSSSVSSFPFHSFLSYYFHYVLALRTLLILGMGGRLTLFMYIFLLLSKKKKEKKKMKNKKKN